MMHDTTLTVIGLDIATPSAEDIRNGATPAIEVTLTTGLALPGPNGMMTLPAGIYRFHMDSKSAQQVADRIHELAKDLPAPSPITTASNLSNIDKIAADLGKFKG